MSQPHRDLWPEDIAVSTIVPPVGILREQAALLGEKTGGLVDGQVVSISVPPSDFLLGIPSSSPYSVSSSSYAAIYGGASAIPKEPMIIHSLYLKVPALDNYRCLLLTVRHGPDLYPLELSYWSTDKWELCGTEESFVARLQEFLTRPETVRLVHSLIAQAHG